MSFRIITADPPWHFATWSRKATRSADAHYHTMTLPDIQRLPVADVADDHALLFLWATWPLLPEAIEIGKAWGFEYVTVGFVWVKMTEKTGNVFMGLGYYTRANSEPCLLFKRGTPRRSWIKDRGINQIILQDDRQRPLFGEDGLDQLEPDTVLHKRYAHSTKPETFYTRTERMFGDTTYLELFARRRRTGWVTLGDAIDGEDIRHTLPRLKEKEHAQE